MKQTIKKFLAAAAAGACVITTSIPAFAATEGLTDDQVTQVEQIAQSYLDTIVGLSDEEAGEMKTYYQYIAPGIYGAINTWEDTKEDLGGYVGSDDVTVESDGETITCTVDAQFEKHDAEVEIIIDQVELLKGEQDALTSIAFNVDYPVSTLMKDAGMNFVIGLGTVFVILIFLTFVISLFGKVAGAAGSKKPAPAEEKKPASVPVPAAVPAEEEEDVTDDAELVAVIAAAIVASENTSTDGFVVRSIKKVNKGRWQRA